MRNLILATLLIFSCSSSWSATFRDDAPEANIRYDFSFPNPSDPWYYHPESSGFSSSVCKGLKDENSVLNLGDGIALSCSLQKSGEGESDYAKSRPEIYQTYLLLDLDRCLFRVTNSVWGIESDGALPPRVTDSEVRGYKNLSTSKEGSWFSSEEETVWWSLQFTIDRLNLSILETEVEAINTDNRVPLPNTKGNASKKHEPQKVIGRGVCKVLSDEEVKREKEEKRRRVEVMEKAAEKTADIERKRIEAIKQERKF